MASYKRHLNKDYTVMPNHHLRNKDLSLKAKGLLSMMLGLPDDWDYSINGLAAISREGRTAVENALKELREAGYVVIRKLYPNQTDSRIIEYEYNIYEFPQGENVASQDIIYQEAHNQGTGFQPLENHQQLNTYKSNTYNKRNIKEIQFDLTGKEETDKSTPEIELEIDIYKYNVQIHDEFEELWKLYPNKKGKTNAFKSYERECKKKKNPAKFEEVKKGLIAYCEYIKATNIEMRFIKNGSTWFNQRCWEDDYTIQNGKNSQTNKKAQPEYELL